MKNSPSSVLKKSQPSARQGENGRKSAVYWPVHEHFEVVFNAGSCRLRVFQHAASAWKNSPAKTMGMATWLAISVFWLVSSMAQEPAPAQDQYAYGFPIQTTADVSFFSVELPLEVYQSVSDQRLRDAGVYNASGQPVPRVFNQTKSNITLSEQSLALNFVTLFDQADAAPDDVQLLFEQQGDRTTLQLNSADTQDTPSAATPSMHIIDLRQVDQTLSALQFSWQAPANGFIGRITIDSSNNLLDWRQQGSGAVADLKQSGTHVQRNRVRMKGTRDNYLRVRGQDLPKDWKLTAIQGSYDTGARPVVRRFEMLQTLGRDEDDGGYLYDLGGAPEADRVRVVLAQANTVIEAVLSYWSPIQNRWISINSSTHYHLGRGDNSIRSSAKTINRVRARRFKLQINQGQPGEAPTLAIGWRPDTLLFLAQGEAPFTLATGRPADANDDFPQQRLYGDDSITSLATNRAANATLGPRKTLGGATNLSPRNPVDWKQLTLWFGLLIGVLFVGLMATKVMKDLKAD